MEGGAELAEVDGEEEEEDAESDLVVLDPSHVSLYTHAITHSLVPQTIAYICMYVEACMMYSE